MKTTFRIFLCLLICASTAPGAHTALESGHWATTESVADNIRFTAFFKASYPTNTGIEIRHVVGNESKQDIMCIRAGEIKGMRFALIGPDGTKIPPYPYTRLHHGSYLEAIVKPGKKDEGFIYLDECFPLEKIGEYRCLITRRIYLNPHTSERMNGNVRGDPYDVTAPEIRFRIESAKPAPPRPVPEPREFYNFGDTLDCITPKRVEPPPGSKPPPAPSASKNKPATTAPSAWWWVLLAIPLLPLAWLGLRLRSPR